MSRTDVRDEATDKTGKLCGSTDHTVSKDEVVECMGLVFKLSTKYASCLCMSTHPISRLVTGAVSAAVSPTCLFHDSNALFTCNF